MKFKSALITSIIVCSVPAIASLSILAPEPIVKPNPMCAHIEQESQMTFYVRSSIANIPDLKYSIDEGQTWTQLVPQHTYGIEYRVDVDLPANSTVYFKGNNPNGWCKDIYDEASIKFSSEFSVAGNVMSLLDNGIGALRRIPNPYCFRYLFNTATKLVSIEDDFLPATGLTVGCYQGMFLDCHSLRQCPELPATTLTDYCYHQMFRCCESIKRIPKLPAMKLAPYCYKEMFWRCVELQSLADPLPATQMAEGCYERMFQQCVSLGRMVTNGLLPAKTLAKRCYHGMFGECTSLMITPSLPATTLKEDCYGYMFDDCDNLTDLTNFRLPAKSLQPHCYECMFLDCKKLEKGPIIPLATTADSCYAGIFKGCKSLKEIIVHFTHWNGNATEDWVADSDDFEFPKTGIFKCPAELSITELRGPNNIPEGWTIESV